VGDYWSFFGTAGELASITALRLEGAFDVSFWLFSGLFADDSVFGGSFGFLAPGLLAFADDELPPALPGPFGDALASLILPTTGFYTVVVTNFASGADDGDGVFPYSLTATGVSAIPLPAGLPLLAAALGGLGWMARRKRRNA